LWDYVQQRKPTIEVKTQRTNPINSKQNTNEQKDIQLATPKKSTQIKQKWTQKQKGLTVLMNARKQLAKIINHKRATNFPGEK
jgi:hypothetical protein